MFPHTITVLTKDEQEVYQRTLIRGVYWYGSRNSDLSEKGKEGSSQITIIVPLALFHGIETGSFIVKGEYKAINSMIELEGIKDCITVNSIEINDVGSELDHAVISGVQGMLIFDVDVHLAGTEELLAGLGLQTGGKAQFFFSNEVLRLADKYVPMANGILKDSAMVTPDKEGITYTAPYARYHWFGKLMVDPVTGKGSFFNPIEGRHWSRPNTPKVLTDRDMEYQGSPLRGPHWVERMWISEGKEIIKSTELFIERNRYL